MVEDKMTFDAAILAGGASKRMGANKAFVELDKKPLVRRVVENLQKPKIFNRIFLVVNDLTQFLSIELELYSDIFPEHGPLGGLHTALHFCKSDYLFVSACDTPLVKPEIIELITHNARGFDACVPVINGNFEPLLAAYSKRALKAVESAINRGERRVVSFFNGVKLKKISEDEIKNLDPKLASFLNANSPEDLERAKDFLYSQ